MEIGRGQDDLSGTNSHHICHGRGAL